MQVKAPAPGAPPSPKALSSPSRVRDARADARRLVGRAPVQAAEAEWWPQSGGPRHGSAQRLAAAEGGREGQPTIRPDSGRAQHRPGGRSLDESPQSQQSCRVEPKWGDCGASRQRGPPRARAAPALQQLSDRVGPPTGCFVWPAACSESSGARGHLPGLQEALLLLLGDALRAPEGSAGKSGAPDGQALREQGSQSPPGADFQGHLCNPPHTPTFPAEYRDAAHRCLLTTCGQAQRTAQPHPPALLSATHPPTPPSSAPSPHAQSDPLPGVPPRPGQGGPGGGV